MKRFTLMLLLALMMVAAAACGAQPGQGSAPSSAPVVESDAVFDLAETVNVQTVATLINSDEVVILDVREQWEYDEGHIPGVTLIPMGQVANRLAEIPTDKEVIVTCRSGNRSEQITDFLRQQGYDNVHNMAGGILAWEAAGYEVKR